MYTLLLNGLLPVDLPISIGFVLPISSAGEVTIMNRLTTGLREEIWNCQHKIEHNLTMSILYDTFCVANSHPGTNKSYCAYSPLNFPNAEMTWKMDAYLPNIVSMLGWHLFANDFLHNNAIAFTITWLRLIAKLVYQCMDQYSTCILSGKVTQADIVIAFGWILHGSCVFHITNLSLMSCCWYEWLFIKIISN